MTLTYYDAIPFKTINWEEWKQYDIETPWLKVNRQNPQEFLLDYDCIDFIEGDNTDFEDFVAFEATKHVLDILERTISTPVIGAYVEVVRDHWEEAGYLVYRILLKDM